MSIMDYFSTGSSPEANLLGSYFKTKAMADIGESVLDRVYKSPKEKLDEVDKRLGIRQKKKALGLPYSDDDYELATNNDLSFTQKGAVAAFGKHISKMVPDPSFLPSPGKWFSMETSFPKTTLSHGVEQILSNGLRIGGKYGRGIGAIGRIFGK